MKNYVWYASYGSNLLLKRFMRYIGGGKVPGSSFSQQGCTDQTPPIKDSPIIIRHQLYFSQSISGWDNMAVAFITPEEDPKYNTLGRMYLISKEQFEQVVWQENNIRDYQNQPNIELDKAIERGSLIVGNSLYNKLLYLGEKDSFPIFTFTSNWADSEIKYYQPGVNYLKVIAEGIKETYAKSKDDIAEYFSNVPGISNNISKQTLMDMMQPD